MAVTDLERLAELAVAPGDAGQSPFEGRDRKLRAAAFDLRREVEANGFRIGRRLRKTLAAQPRGELPPVGGVCALGVIGLRRAGVGLGGLRQRRQAAAQAPGGREQGRGVRAGSPGLERRAFRLSGYPGRLREDCASGRMARQHRPGGGCRRRRLARAGRGRLSRRRGTRLVFRGLGVARTARPPGLRCRPRREDGAQLRRGPGRGGGELGRGRGGRSRRVAIRRLGAVPRIAGRAWLRVQWPEGLKCGRPQASAKQGERDKGTLAQARSPNHVFRRLGGVRSDRQSVFGTLRGAHWAEFPGFSHCVRAPFESCPIMASLSDIPTPRQAGRIPRHTA